MNAVVFVKQVINFALQAGKLFAKQAQQIHLADVVHTK